MESIRVDVGPVRIDDRSIRVDVGHVRIDVGPAQIDVGCGICTNAFGRSANRCGICTGHRYKVCQNRLSALCVAR